jgi:RNA polymerase sigma factor (sigma-70 family)
MNPIEPALIQRYLQAESPKDEDALLAVLVFENASPLIRKTIARRLTSSPEQDRDDVAGDVITGLIAHLKKLKYEGGVPIDSFAAYTAVSAHNGCDRYLRQRYPERHRLKNRLRYLFSKTQQFSVWDDPERGCLCGRAAWKGRPPVTPDPEQLSRLTTHDQSSNMILTEVFNLTAAPVEFDALVEIVATVWGIRDRTPVELVEGCATANQMAADEVIAQRQSLKQLWSEIVALPQPQRIALLLNLRDITGGSAVWLLPSGGIASVRRIAELVGIPAEEFAQLWSRLPMNDAEIGERLSVTRQQVINFRQAARQRLARRLRARGTATT